MHISGAIHKSTVEFLTRALRDQMDPRVIGFVCANVPVELQGVTTWARISDYLPMLRDANTSTFELLAMLNAVIPDSQAFYRGKFFLFWIANRHYDDWLNPHQILFLSSYKRSSHLAAIDHDENGVAIAMARAADAVRFISLIDDQNLVAGQVRDHDGRHLTSVNVERSFRAFQSEARTILPYFAKMLKLTGTEVVEADAPTYSVYASGVTA